MSALNRERMLELYARVEKLQTDNTKAWSKVSVAEYRTEQLLKENAVLYEVVDTLAALITDEDQRREDWPEIIKARQLLARRP